MLVQFSVRRILTLAAIDCLGSIGLLYLSAITRGYLGILPEALVLFLTRLGIPVFPLQDLSTSYLLPWPTALGVGIIWPFFFIVFGVYEGHRNQTLVDELRNVVAATSVSFITLAGFLFFTYRNTARLVLLLFFVFDLALLIAARLALYGYRQVRPSGRIQRQVVLIVGAGNLGRNVAQQLVKYSRGDFELLGFVDDDPGKKGGVIDGLPVLGTLDDIPVVVAQHYVEDAVVALPLRAHARLVEACGSLQTALVRAHVVPDLFALSFPGASLHGFGGIPVIDLGWTGIDGWRYVWKRLFDVACAIPCLICIAPLTAVVSLAIKLDSSGPVFYRQRRLGRNGRPFEMLKFRSMRDDADSAIHQAHVTELITKNTDVGDVPEDQGSLKLVNDPRVTRVGRFIRKTSLDELPQLINVLKGDMSLVGPRPPMEYEAKLYHDWHRRRFEAPPGITGLWQIKGRNQVSFDEMVRMDLEYISSQSIWLDFKILLQTPLAVFHGKGAG